MTQLKAAPKDETKDKIKDKSAIVLLHLIRRLSLKNVQRLGQCLGWILWNTHSRMRQTTQTNIEKCLPHLSTQEQHKLAYTSLCETGKTILETGLIWGHDLEYGRQLIRSVSGEHRLDAALNHSSGLLLLLPHLGNWELTNHYLTQKTPITAMYKPAKLKSVDTLMYKARSNPNTYMAPANQSGVKALLKTLKKGGVTVILPDQEPPQPAGIFAPFFNQIAYTGLLAPKLIQQTHCQCLCIFTKRLASGAGFEVCIRPASELIYSENLREAVEGLNQSVENCVNEAVEQYQWDYKRFKRQPEGVDAFYY